MCVSSREDQRSRGSMDDGEALVGLQYAYTHSSHIRQAWALRITRSLQSHKVGFLWLLLSL